MFESIEFTKGDLPIYRQLRGHDRQKDRRGRADPGDALPRQRDLARLAGVNLTTVTRAFATLQERGLVESRPGRGSVVARAVPVEAFKSSPLDEADFIDLSVNRPATAAYLGALSTLMPQLAHDPRYSALQDFHAPAGPIWAREALADWLAPAGRR